MEDTFHRAEGGSPDLAKIVFHPTLLGKVLREFLVPETGNDALAVHEQRAHSGGASVYRQHSIR
jgi:hypothetical protein